MNERRRGFVQRIRGKKRAVSPVVATLILILIAVAAAAALYLWLVAWQGNITGGIGQPSTQYTVTVGGSTSVYPFAALAATWFEQNNSDVTISVNGGGTGAGMLAVCAGNINVGTASTPETPAGLAATDNCPATPGVTVTPIAYDAVDVDVASANSHGLLSINYDTLNVIYSQGSTQTPNKLASSFTIDGAAQAITLPAQGTELVWDQIPAAVQGATFTGIGVAGDSPEAVATGGIGVGAACTGAGFTNDVCSTTGATGTSPCGWTVCAGPFGTTATIVPIQRSDAAGATLTFEAKLLGYTSASAVATSFSGLGYSGCGSDNLLSDCGIILPGAQSGSGDSGVLSLIGGNPNAIGYASDGLTRTTASVGVSGIIPFLALGESVGHGLVASTTGMAYGGVVPSTGSTGTIAAGITDSTTANQYSGWRPFEFVTLQPPTGEVQRFIEFITDPANNIALATVTSEVSLYQI